MADHIYIAFICSHIIVADDTLLTGSNAGVSVTMDTPANSLGGTFLLSFGFDKTGDIAFDATPSSVETALEALPTVGGDVEVIRTGPGVVGDCQWTVRFVLFAEICHLSKPTIQTYPARVLLPLCRRSLQEIRLRKFHCHSF